MPLSSARASDHVSRDRAKDSRHLPSTGIRIAKSTGCGPNQQVPVQFSCHVIPAPGAAPVHHEWIARGSDDPRPRIAESLTLFGIIEYEYNETGLVSHHIRWDYITKAMSAPQTLLNQVLAGKLLIDDPEAHMLCHPTNCAFRGQDLFSSNLGRWHITRTPVGVEGLPLP